MAVELKIGCLRPNLKRCGMIGRGRAAFLNRHRANSCAGHQASPTGPSDYGTIIGLCDTRQQISSADNAPIVATRSAGSRAFQSTGATSALAIAVPRTGAKKTSSSRGPFDSRSSPKGCNTPPSYVDRDEGSQTHDRACRPVARSSSGRGYLFRSRIRREG